MSIIKARVLLVDDNRDAVDTVSHLLDCHSIENKVAYDGHSAVALLSEWPAQIVFLDIQMPGKDGFETAKDMHTLPGYASLPIVAWTDWDGPGSLDAITDSRMVHRLVKPASVEELVDLICKYAPGEH